MFELPYVNNSGDLRKEINRRASSGCRERARRYLLGNFGFDCDEHLPEFSGVGMWRQFFGLHFENVVAETFCRAYGFDKFDLTYLYDGFTSLNPFKYSLVKPKFFIDGKISRYTFSEDFRERQVIENVSSILNSHRAVELHRRLASRAGLSVKSWDISDFFSTVVFSALHHMSFEKFGAVFDSLFLVDWVNGIKVRKKLVYDEAYSVFRSDNEALNRNELLEVAEKTKILPSAKTYYSQLYLFIPGILAPSYAQIEAVFELADEAIFAPAAEGFRRCKEVTGFYPLIIPMPDFNLLEEFRFTKNPACVCICSEIDFKFSPSGNFYSDFLNIGRRLLL